MNTLTQTITSYLKAICKIGLVVSLVFFSSHVFAAESAATVAKNIYGTFGDVAKLIIAAAYVAGLGFAIGAIMKFKQHKDNPTQIPIGTPIALMFIAAALVFLPTVFGVTGKTLFGTAEVGGASGTLIQDIS